MNSASAMPEAKKPDACCPTGPFECFEPDEIAKLNELYRIIENLRIEDQEQKRYGAAAEESEACLCTPVGYEIELDHIPDRILAVDYGCGDPNRYAESGERVLDLGSGSGKHCFMLAKKVGAQGHVVGIDKTPEMLKLSREAIEEVSSNLASDSPPMEFKHGLIENLYWDLDRLQSALKEFGQPTSYSDLAKIRDHLNEKPMVPTNSMDLVVSNCVLNLVADSLKPQLFEELFRVLDRGGRAVISDIVAEDDVPEDMKKDEELWTGCVSGAMKRDEFLKAFEDAGFYGVQELSSFEWRVVQGIRFYSVTIVAYKGKEGPCWETGRTALYPGPFSAVQDDDGHRFERGVATPVCEKTAKILSRPPYSEHFVVSEATGTEADKVPFACDKARRTKSSLTTGSLKSGGQDCDPSTGCC